MLSFESLVARHGEFAVQALIERIERNDGVDVRTEMLLEERWAAVMEIEAAASTLMAS